MLITLLNYCMGRKLTFRLALDPPALALALALSRQLGWL